MTEVVTDSPGLVAAAPFAGTVLPMARVPDPVFAAEMVGAGAAIDPVRRSGHAVAPVDGTVVKAHPHAFVVVSGDGVGVLVHLGIDTVQLQGTGFEVLVQEGERVGTGQPLVHWDPAAVEAGGRSPIIAVAVMDSRPGSIAAGPERSVAAGEALFELPGRSPDIPAQPRPDGAG